MKYKLDVWILPKCILHFIWSNYISVKCKWCFTPQICNSSTDWKDFILIHFEPPGWSSPACHRRIIAYILFLFRHLSPQERQITSLWTATTYSILSSGSPGPVVLFSRHREKSRHLKRGHYISPSSTGAEILRDKKQVNLLPSNSHDLFHFNF